MENSTLKENKEKLKANLRKKRNARSARPSRPTEIPDLSESGNILDMMERVNSILKTNPQMVQQISKAVSSVMNNKDLMESLSGQLETEIKKTDQSDQILVNNSEGESKQAESKDSTQ